MSKKVKLKPYDELKKKEMIYYEYPHCIIFRIRGSWVSFDKDCFTKEYTVAEGSTISKETYKEFKELFED